MPDEAMLSREESVQHVNKKSTNTNLTSLTVLARLGPLYITPPRQSEAG